VQSAKKKNAKYGSRLLQYVCQVDVTPHTVVGTAKAEKGKQKKKKKKKKEPLPGDAQDRS
jgi:hypothetical protein